MHNGGINGFSGSTNSSHLEVSLPTETPGVLSDTRASSSALRPTRFPKGTGSRGTWLGLGEPTDMTPRPYLSNRYIIPWISIYLIMFLNATNCCLFLVQVCIIKKTYQIMYTIRFKDFCVILVFLFFCHFLRNRKTFINVI